jgi:hypothetical protein
VRRFQTSYAGLWSGYCKTRENAIVAATRHLVNDGYSRATITDRETGEDVVRLSLSADRKRATITLVEPLQNRVGK